MALLNLIFSKPHAQIGGVSIDASFNENHIYTSVPTRNPVEKGAQITDHVDLEPFRLSMDCIISDSPIDFGILNQVRGIASTVTSAISGSTRSKDAWDELLKLRNERQPFTAVTGLAVYENMILTVLDLNRNASTGQSINFHSEMEQIRIIGDDDFVDQSLASTAKNIASKTRNLGQKVLDRIDDVAQSKLFQGASLVFSSMQAVFR